MYTLLTELQEDCQIWNVNSTAAYGAHGCVQRIIIVQYQASNYSTSIRLSEQCMC